MYTTRNPWYVFFSFFIYLLTIDLQTDKVMHTERERELIIIY